MRKLYRPEFLIASIIVLLNLVSFVFYNLHVLKIYIAQQKLFGHIRNVEYNDYHQKNIYTVEFYYNKDFFLVTNETYLKFEHSIGDTIEVIFERNHPENALILEDKVWVAIFIHSIITAFILYGYYKYGLYFLNMKK